MEMQHGISSGKRQSLGKRLASVSSETMDCMRIIAEYYSFLKRTNDEPDHVIYPDIVRFLLFTRYNAVDSCPRNLFRFLETYPNINVLSPIYHETKSILDFMNFSFTDGLPTVQSKHRHMWSLAIFSMIHETHKHWVLRDKHDAVNEFVKDFYGKVYDGFPCTDIARFSETAYTQWTERSIYLRQIVLMDKFLTAYPLPIADRWGIAASSPAN